MTKEHKKQLIYGTAVLLALGASLTLGLLSFGGMYALYPSISLGIESFILASLYEGEIYFQNIRQAMKKIFDPNYFDNEFAQNTIEEIISSSQNDQSDLPKFFKDYQAAKQNLESISASLPDSKEEEKAEKNIALMHRYFFKATNGSLRHEQSYARELRSYLEKNEETLKLTSLLEQLKNKKTLIKASFYFCALSSTIFSLGSAYLILETLATLSFLALPVPMIIAMAIICGISSAYLTFNSLSDMIANDTLQSWYSDLKEAINDKTQPGKAAMLTLGSILLIGLAFCLTIFTAGTWWTIAKETPNLPALIKRIPTFITQILIPSISATATLIFTLENTKNSLDEILKVLENLPQKTVNFFKERYEKSILFFQTIRDSDRPRYQQFNPFNFLIYIIENPLKVIGFTAHIGSVSVTTSRIPYVPIWLTVVLAFLSEFFEDLHYFFLGKCDGTSNHNHNNDIPTRFINLIIKPLRWLSYGWHSKGQQWFSEPKDFYNAWPNPSCCEPTDIKPHEKEQHTSTHWQQQKVLMQLDEKIGSLKNNDKLSNDKKNALTEIYYNVSKVNVDVAAKTINPIKSGFTIARETRVKIAKQLKKEKQVLSQHRHFWHVSDKTDSAELLESLRDEQEKLPTMEPGYRAEFV